MKMKNKLLSIGLIALATLGLTACSKPDDAKNAFIDNAVQLNDPAYNRRKVSFKFEKFNFSSANSKDNDVINKMLTGSTMDTVLDLDADKKQINMDLALKLTENNQIKLGYFMDKSGIYLETKDLKGIYEQSKGFIPSSNSNIKAVFDSLFNSLTKPYLFLSSDFMNVSLKSSNRSQTYSDSLDSLIKSATFNEKSWKEQAKKLPNEIFKKEGDKATMQNSVKDTTVAKEIKNYPELTQNMTQKEKDKLIEDTKNMKINSLNYKFTFNGKAHTADGTIEGKISDTTNSKSFVEFKVSFSSKTEKLTTTLKAPDTAETTSAEELQKLMTSALMKQYSSAS